MGCPYRFFFLVFDFCTLLLSSFWTSRGHRCRPFPAPVLAFYFYRAQGSAIPLLGDFSSTEQLLSIPDAEVQRVMYYGVATGPAAGPYSN